MQDDSQSHIETLTREDSTGLLQRGSFVGRVGFIHDGRPHIVPVNYLAETPDTIVFWSMEGTKLSALAGGAAVVFEVDDQRPLYHAGWSVIARGTASEVTDPHELERLRRGPLRSWAASAGGRWIRIRVDEVTGRRIPEA
ncbi:MAG TPA: pyridoxamine 5'-phosphate oxidase family protein [Candidatus Dormibacteraeota bacterium]|jgi:nitroimidazol reductase NimA-like FMN-containing flavoprotein (pyridoxamine 5'-phosphate oxidase superfamily)|nr:pyridoxamine 5'-phosphate oxidase family protein [Candidatus Dormibacteraeota bacterium]